MVEEQTWQNYSMDLQQVKNGSLISISIFKN